MSLFHHTLIEDVSPDREDDTLTTEIKKLAKNKPVLCSQVQPWKNPEVTHEMIVEDLKGCIIKHYLAYKFGTIGYTPADAISDAYQAIIKAIEKDKCAPTLATKTVECSKCKTKIAWIEPFEGGEAFWGDVDKYEPKIRLKKYKGGKPKYAFANMPGDARGNEICMVSPRPMRFRRFWIECPECGHTFWQKVYKVAFSTLVYPFIRSAIQRSAQKWRRTNVVPMRVYSKDTPTTENRGSVLSIDNPVGTNNEFAIKDFLTAPAKEQYEEIPESVVILLREVISEMPANHQIAIAFNKGIGGLVSGVVPCIVRCRHCTEGKKPTEFEAQIDYSLCNNTAVCPSCGTENEVDMRLSQTDIASYLRMTKQRVCNILHTVEKKLYESLRHKVNCDLL